MAIRGSFRAGLWPERSWSILRSSVPLLRQIVSPSDQLGRSYLQFKRYVLGILLRIVCTYGDCRYTAPFYTPFRARSNCLRTTWRRARNFPKQIGETTRLLMAIRMAIWRWNARVCTWEQLGTSVLSNGKTLSMSRSPSTLQASRRTSRSRSRNWTRRRNRRMILWTRDMTKFPRQSPMIWSNCSAACWDKYVPCPVSLNFLMNLIDCAIRAPVIISVCMLNSLLFPFLSTLKLTTLST